MKTCRLCMTQKNGDDILPILDDFAIKIMDYVSINVNMNEELSKYICKCCVEEILHWETFRNMCHQSNEVLLSNIKIECKDLDESLIKLGVIEIVDQNSHREMNDVKHEVNEKTVVDNYHNEDENDDIESLEYFLDSNDLPEDTIYECEFCNQNFDSCFDFLDHQNGHEGDALFKCDKCTEVFNSRKNIIEHERTHPVPCQYCDKLILKSSMRAHLMKHMGKFKCPECSMTCNSNAALNQHIMIVHSNIKDHVCETCGKSFSSLSSLRVHRQSHADVRMYPCKQCPYAGRTSSALYIHMATHAKDECVCGKCGKIYKSNRNLNDHVRRAHSDCKKYGCVHCQKRFVDKYQLKIHLRWHSNVRPYKCTVCLKAFIRADGLREHMNIHLPRNLMECSKCGKTFGTKQAARRHDCLDVLRSTL